MPFKIKLSSDLFYRTIDLLESLEVDDYPPETIQLFGYVLYSFNQKKADFKRLEAFSAPFDDDLDPLRFASGITYSSSLDDEPF